MSTETLPAAYQHDFSEWEQRVADALFRELGQVILPEHFEGVVQGIASRLGDTGGTP